MTAEQYAIQQAQPAEPLEEIKAKFDRDVLATIMLAAGFIDGRQDDLRQAFEAGWNARLEGERSWPVGVKEQRFQDWLRRKAI